MTIPPTSVDRDQRLRELGRVTGELLHDLGGLIAILAGRITLAREEAALGRTPADELARIQADADEIRQMVLEVLDEIRGVRPALEVTFPVEATLEQVVNRWLVGSRSVTTTLNSSLRKDVQLSGPRSFFSRAIGNLLRNAARHARSEIRLSVRLLENGGAVEIRIEDDGDGIPADLKDRLFDPFVTGSSEGTGLGLSLARWSVERLGGTLTVGEEASVLGGATFCAILPLSSMARQMRPKPAGAPRYRPAPLSAAPLKGLKVAVVDDDPAVRRTFSRLLRRSGAEVVEPDPAQWRSTAQAVQCLCDEPPDLILLDLHLRDLATAELYTALKHDVPEVASRVVFFTGGVAPHVALDRPVVNKMLAWDDLVLCILAVVQPRV